MTNQNSQNDRQLQHAGKKPYRQHSGPMNDQMESKLKRVRDQMALPRKLRFDNNLPGCNRWAGDGVDHINISDIAVTDLGVLLSVDSPDVPLYHDVLGRFNNLLGLWHYVNTEEQDDALRRMKPAAIRKMVKRLTNRRIRNFYAIMIDAAYQRVKAHKVFAEAVAVSTLPFDCYTRENSGMRCRTAYQSWFVQGMEEIRRALRENRVPDLLPFMDSPNEPLLIDVNPNLFNQGTDQPRRERGKNSILTQINAGPAQTEKADQKNQAAKPGRGQTECLVHVDESSIIETEVKDGITLVTDSSAIGICDPAATTAISPLVAASSQDEPPAPQV